ncbi:MAG: 2-isopropylmalate synthase, partial [Proteiniphilum sp.]|nr:2-isopropylmalate synthase [Proteiniphilum sp.]
MRRIEIMDTTLRDGEQTSGVSFVAQEKVSIVSLLLEELKVDRVEIASARVSEGEFRAVQKMVQWATAHGYLDRL